MVREVIGIGSVLKTVLLMNGIRDFKLTFDAPGARVVMTGTKYGEPFEEHQSFEELENSFNNEQQDGPAETSTDTGRPESTDPHKLSDEGSNVQPERS